MERSLMHSWQQRAPSRHLVGIKMIFKTMCKYLILLHCQIVEYVKLKEGSIPNLVSFLHFSRKGILWSIGIGVAIFPRWSKVSFFHCCRNEPVINCMFASLPKNSCFIVYRFAIYIPLFLPMSLPLVMSLFAAIKWLRSKDEDEQAKSKQSRTG